MRDEPVADPDPEYLGPAMLNLTPKQRRFVVGWIAAGGKNGARVARAAGYSDKSGAARVTAHGLVRDSRVVAALREEADRRLDGNAAVAVAVLEALMAHSNPNVKQKAADSILDRTGFGRGTKQIVQVEHFDTRSTAELLASVARLQAERRAAGLLPFTIDGDCQDGAATPSLVAP